MQHTQTTISATNRRVVTGATSRPRVLGWIRSAALLDGDWGTSIAYVLGIGFALAGYSSFWHLMLMLGLTTIVALNYITICRLYPNGGGVYTSVYQRSKNIAVIGALLLAADYIITIALSILEAFHYFGIAYPRFGAIVSILAIGILNWFGPKHSGSLAFIISILTLLAIFAIIIASAPIALPTADIHPPIGSVLHNWGVFAGLILSISGIESISNMTGLMKDPAKTSRSTILTVLAKVVVITIFLGLAMHAVPNLSGHTEDMVRFLGEHYIGAWFGWIVAISLGLLLISAGNTALNGLVSVQYLMAADRELPTALRKLNRHGVPVLPLIISTVAAVLVLLFIHDLLTLAQLYAIGVVGAVLLNIAATATDSAHDLSKTTRLLMLISAIVLFFVELSIAIGKPKATVFATTVLGVGLIARYISQHKAELLPVDKKTQKAKSWKKRLSASQTNILVAVRGRNIRLLEFALEEAILRKAKLLILQVREIRVGTLPELPELHRQRNLEQLEAICEQSGVDYRLITLASNDVGYTIAEQAALFGAFRVFLGTSRRNLLEMVLRGSVIRIVSKLLPEEIQLVIFCG